jgi:7-cyano-7-deazaguanine reductase
VGAVPRPEPARPSKELVAVPNPHPGRDYEVRCEAPEFTCVCPMTGQPDFATFTISYSPGQHIVELKSLKLYLWSYRQEGAFHEDVTNRILDDLVGCLEPRRMTVVSVWNVRGGITTTVRASYPPFQMIDTRVTAG